MRKCVRVGLLGLLSMVWWAGVVDAKKPRHRVVLSTRLYARVVRVLGCPGRHLFLRSLRTHRKIFSDCLVHDKTKKSGKLAMRWRVDEAKGRVIWSRVKTPLVGRARLQACLLRAVRKVRFSLPGCTCGLLFVDVTFFLLRPARR